MMSSVVCILIDFLFVWGRNGKRIGFFFDYYLNRICVFIDGRENKNFIYLIWNGVKKVGRQYDVWVDDFIVGIG